MPVLINTSVANSAATPTANMRPNGSSEFFATPQTALNENQVENQQQTCADEPKAFAQHTVNRIGVRLGNSHRGQFVATIGSEETAPHIPQREHSLGLIEMKSVGRRFFQRSVLLRQHRCANAVRGSSGPTASATIVRPLLPIAADAPSRTGGKQHCDENGQKRSDVPRSGSFKISSMGNSAIASGHITPVLKPTPISRCIRNAERRSDKRHFSEFRRLNTDSGNANPTLAHIDGRKAVHSQERDQNQGAYAHELVRMSRR